MKCYTCHTEMFCESDVNDNSVRIDWMECPKCYSYAEIEYGENGKYIKKVYWDREGRNNKYRSAPPMYSIESSVFVIYTNAENHENKYAGWIKDVRKNPHTENFMYDVLIYIPHDNPYIPNSTTQLQYCAPYVILDVDEKYIHVRENR